MKKFNIILLIIVCHMMVFSESEDIHELWTTNWSFTKGDIINNPTSTDSNWESIPISAPWQLSLKSLADYNGIGTYKTKVNIIYNSKVGLLLPISYGKYSVYFNNNLLLEASNKFGNKPILIEVPKPLINSTDNELIITTEPFSNWGGFGGVMSIGSYELLNQKFVNHVVKNSAIAFIAIFLSLYFLIMHLFRQEDKYNLIFSMLSFSVSIFSLGFTALSYYIFNYSWAYWLFTFLGGIGMYLFPILFIHSFFNLKLKIIGKIFTWVYTFLALFVLVEYLFTGQLFFFNKYLYMAFNMSYILVVIYLIVISIKNVRKRLIYSKIMLLATILLTITFVYSMLGFMNIIIAVPLIGEGFFLMTLMFSIVLAKRAAQTHSDLEFAHADLEFTNAENVALNDTLEEKVEERTLELREKNAEITQSIEYSALIQNSMLPSDEQFSKVFSDHYAVWKPKDTVGGDFYWFKQLEEGFILAIIDCTGHGVPGALLTMTATAALERIVTHINSTDPALMLKEMNKIVKRLLSQDNPYDIKDDGLDIGLCYYNSNDKKMTFAGSKIRLFIDDDGELLEIRGDRQGIGYKRSKAYYSYTNHVINVTDTKTFHMTTDGFLDQSGGEKGFGYGWTKYRKLLIKNRDLPLKDQIERIEEELLDYQGDESQRDDITLLGFKIKLD